MRMRLCCLLLVIAHFSHAQSGILMNRYDQSSHGANLYEHHLTVASVGGKHFGKLYGYYVDGAVYAQPLFVPGVTIAQKGTRNVVYIVTMNDKAYAFDATQSGSPLWMRDFTDEASGVTPVPVADITGSNDLNIVGNLGIESTPVIDLASQSMFVVVRTKESGRYVQRLHRLDLRTGKDQLSPILIEARVHGSAKDAVDGYVHFDPRAGNQRTSLAISNGNVVIAWASHEDIGPYHGWIMAYDATTLKQTGALCTTPDGTQGGIWQSGRGPVVDATGSLYFEVGNGDYDGKQQFGNSVIRVSVDKAGLHVEDSYTPHDFAKQNETDADLGSTGPMLIAETKTLICGNKQGEIVLLDSRHLGGMTPEDKGIEQTVALNGGRVLAGPSYWDGPAGPTLFIWNETSVPQAFRFNGNLLNPERVAKGAVASHGSPGGALTVSSDGAKPGTGILWATVGIIRSADHGNASGVLHAFSAETLQELWNSEAEAKRDRMGTLVKFVPPLVIDGRVYVASYDNAVNVYGGLPETAK